MSQTWKKFVMAALVAIFVSGAVLTPAMTYVFAAEQTTDQEQQTPPSDAPQGGHDEHSGHHG